MEDVAFRGANADGASGSRGESSFRGCWAAEAGGAGGGEPMGPPDGGQEARAGAGLEGEGGGLAKWAADSGGAGSPWGAVAGDEGASEQLGGVCEVDEDGGVSLFSKEDWAKVE